MKQTIKCLYSNRRFSLLAFIINIINCIISGLLTYVDFQYWILFFLWSSSTVGLFWWFVAETIMIEKRLKGK